MGKKLWFLGQGRDAQKFTLTQITMQRFWPHFTGWLLQGRKVFA